MRTSQRLLLILACGVLPAAANSLGCDAAAIWEQMVAAKGGRARLEQVESLYFSLESKYWNWESLRVRSARRLDFFVFPSFVWSRSEQSDPRFGTRVVTIDLEKAVTWSSDGGTGDRPTMRVIRGDLVLTQDAVVLLFETRWTKPTVIGCRDKKVEGIQNKIVTARVESYDYEFYLEKKSWLPWLVTMLPVSGPKPEYYPEFRLIDYHAVQGIALPKRYAQRTRFKYKVATEWGGRTHFEVNPEYDPAVKTRLPSVAAGPEVWRKKAR